MQIFILFKLNSVQVLFAPDKYEDTAIGTNDMSEIDIWNAEFLFVNEFDSNVGSQNNNPEIPEVAKIESLGSSTILSYYIIPTMFLLIFILNNFVRNTIWNLW